MRFNSKELVHMAQNGVNFDKEGVLLMKERQDTLLKKREAYVERYFRLKGNLLFYFKNKDSIQKSEPLGLMILERCTVELESKEEIPNAFVMVFEGENNVFKFAGVSEDDRDDWIKSLHIASYECLKMQLESLTDQLQGKTGSNPFPQQPQAHSGVDLDSHSEDNINEESILEVSLECSDLPCDSSGQLPNPLLVLHTLLPPDQLLWSPHNHTEIVEKNGSPQFLKTVGFGDSENVNLMTRVKVTVYHVVERMTGTMVQLGQSIFTLQDVVTADDSTLTVTIKSPELRECGKLTIVAWTNGVLPITSKLQSPTGRKTKSEIFCKSISKQDYSPKDLFENVICKSYRFATNSQKEILQVHEYMAESKWSVDIPHKLLKLLIQEEKEKISVLQGMGELSGENNQLRQEMGDSCMIAISKYTQSLATISIASDEGMYYKRSCDKDKRELEFIPVNVHLQRIAVGTEGSKQGTVYDSITTGAFTAYSQKYKHGGLKRVLQSQLDLYTPQSTLGQRTKLHQACSILSELSELKYVINLGCEKLCQTLSNSATDHVQAKIDFIANKSRKLVQLCDDQLLQSSSTEYSQSKTTANDGKDTAASLSQMKELKSKDTPSPSAPQQPTFKSKTVEPWEVTSLNLEAAVVCLISKVEEMLKYRKEEELDTSKWLNEISPAIVKLQKFVDIVSQRANLFLTFLSLRENRFNIKLMHAVKYRRDIVLTHTISTLITGIISKFHTNIKNTAFFNQIAEIGLLAEFESFLSCYGDEIAMMEDMIIGVDDLSSVTLSFSISSDGTINPTLSLKRCLRSGKFPDINRHCIHIDLGVSEDSYNQLPSTVQTAENIRIVPLLFNVGINEMATCAEKFGSTGLQDNINTKGVTILVKYYEDYIKHFANPEEKHIQDELSLLVKQLQTNVLSKKNKNVEILHVASELCRKLNGMNFVSCKSGKDRTSMGVTLQQVQILQQEHDLASHVFWQALDCFRSVGCRRENTLKNTGIKKYAFNSLQLLSFPKLYKPPAGTYGNVQS
ncbi:hypothetical protein LOTGIDRAFT_230548 [Lottia gigantea]|uniref:PH domain-containing protein n=1 Tax=Lottia gigantea TaxID=225164 RepID=V4B3Z4_LOTGI|nr:hypothetical protein LOTGIDRAFT_230548 [Lottia gigantea]ESP02136.1 hypothetical protein LOTGIDRAFT_230548 [Lottia gigantea]